MAVSLDCNMKVCAKETINKGKGLFACSPFKEGDVILEEQPLVSTQFSWNEQYDYTSCNNCMKSLETAQNMGRRLTGNYELELPYTNECCDLLKQQRLIQKCPKCQKVFCCEECFLEADEKYHRCLCSNSNDFPMETLENTWRKMHYPPEKTSIMLIVRVLAIIIQSYNPQCLMEMIDTFFIGDKNKEEMINQQLLGNDYQDKLKQLYQLLKEVMPIERYHKFVTLDGFSSLFAMVGVNGQNIGTSSLTQYVHNVDALGLSDSDRLSVDAVIDRLYDDIEKESGQFINCEGTGLFQWQSRCNHSCAPNAEVTFPYNNNTLVLVALVDIHANEEIFISYLNECQRSRSRHTRHKLLWENFAYTCTCSHCEMDTNESSEASSDESADEMIDDS